MPPRNAPPPPRNLMRWSKEMQWMDDVALAKWTSELARAQRYDWYSWARPNQREPESYRNWLIKAGRGFGKTRTGAETVRRWATERTVEVAVVAKAHRELQNICFEGPAGLLKVFPPDEIVEYSKGLGGILIRTSNGSVIRGFSAQDPDIIRGYAFDGLWFDEYAAWHRNVAQDMFDNGWFTLREAPNPRVVITTTPKRVPHVTKLMERLKEDAGVVLSEGHTMENAANLSGAAMDELLRQYEGTRLGLQELAGVMLDDVEHALWGLELIEHARWPVQMPDEASNDYADYLTGKLIAIPDPLPPFARVITSVDPSGSPGGDATGIVTVAMDVQGRFYVLADDTTNGPAEYRYEKACLAAAKHGASMLLYEAAYGGDNIALGLRSAWKHLRSSREVTGLIPQLHPSPIQGDKVRRAEPVVALFEQQYSRPDVERIWMVGEFPELEDEMTTWEPGPGSASPNRIDAMVHGIRYLMRNLGQEAQIHAATGSRGDVLARTQVAPLPPTPPNGNGNGHAIAPPQAAAPARPRGLSGRRIAR
jgi:phage terminase large subunit-like protein